MRAQRHRSVVPLHAFALIALWLAGVGTAVAAAMGSSEARHLLLRTGFNAAPDEVRALAALPRAAAVERLLAEVRTEPGTAPAPELDRWTPRSQLRALSVEERRARLRETIQQGQELRGWWFQEMLVTPSPFTERMTLFWHNHFVSSLRKVRPTRLMYRQNLLLRRHSLGNFRDMLHAVARDPAMIVYLDNASNRKGQPNENFAREVMELFTLGEGHYGEHDVKEAARAFTGWGIDGETGAFLFRPALHDDGVKTILGRSGTFDGGDVLDILLAQPQTAELVVRKLWRELVSSQPDAGEIRRVADEFRASGYDIRAAVRGLLTSEAFYAEANRAALVKSPVDLLVGTLRQFRFEVGDPFPFVVLSRQLGQDLMAPPNVKGWPGAEAWINAGTLLARKQIVARLFRDSERGPQPSQQAAAAMEATAMAAAAPSRYQRAMRSVRFDEARWAAQLRETTVEEIAQAMLPAAPVNPIGPAPDRLAVVRQLALDPAYQLK
jgi:uncharacterized protein (DUF1800 family)